MTALAADTTKRPASMTETGRGWLLYRIVVATGSGLVAGNYVAYGAALRGIDGFLELGIGAAVLMGAFVLAVTHR